MSNLKVYEKITVVTLKDWTQLQAPINIDKLMQACNSWTTFIKIDGVMVNINTIANAREKETNDLDDFILWFDNQIQQNMRSIIKEREAKWRKTNTTILKNAYLTKYWVKL